MALDEVIFIPAAASVASRLASPVQAAFPPDRIDVFGPAEFITFPVEDDEGPAPVGLERAPASLPKVAQVQHKEDGRDEWMLHPGEHDFLQGMDLGKTRTFLNKKARGEITPLEIMDPQIQAQVEAIYAAHNEARGPSLMDQHRVKVTEERAAKAADGKEGFGWNRDKDLDAGRRVDKEALKMILGGASNELKDKFQGGYGRT